MRTAARLDRANALGRQRVVPHQKLGVFPGEDVVGDDAKLVTIAKRAAQREKERRLAAADRPADADRERPRAIVAHLPAGALVEETRARRVVVIVRIW